MFLDGALPEVELLLKPGIQLAELLPLALVVTALLGHAAYTDIFKGQIIKNQTSLALFLVACAASPLLFPDSLEHSLTGFGIVFLIFLVCLIKPFFAMGDIKILMGLGVLLGVLVVYVILFACVIVLIYAIPSMIRSALQKKKLGLIAAGPGITLAVPVALVQVGAPLGYGIVLALGQAAFVLFYWVNDHLERKAQAHEDASEEADFAADESGLPEAA